jgi:hypothetical protein
MASAFALPFHWPMKHLWVFIYENDYALERKINMIFA